MPRRSCGGKAGRVALGRLDLGARAAHWVGIVGRWLGAARVCRWPGYAARARPPRAAVGGGRGARTSRATWGPVRCAVGGEVRGNLFCLGGPRINNVRRQAVQPATSAQAARSNPLIIAYTCLAIWNSSEINTRGSRLGVHRTEGILNRKLQDDGPCL